MLLSLFILNLRRHPRHVIKLHRYVGELGDFLQFYLQERYGVVVDIRKFLPKPYFENYSDVQAYDQLDVKKTGDGLQLYLGYSMDFKNTAGHDVVGMCECLKKGEIHPGDMMVAEMGTYRGISLLVPTIYRYYENLSVSCTHELDHQILRLQGNDNYVSGVHAAARRPFIYWTRSESGGYSEGFTPPFRIPYFVSQQDPRVV